MDITLVAETGRSSGTRNSRRLRREEKLPAVVYGLGADPIAVAVPEREVQRILTGESGANTLINLEIEGDRQLVFARQVQRHPVRGTLIHVDFVRVRRDIAVTAEVPIHAVGEPEGVKDGGLLEQVLFTLTVEAKPDEIPTSIEVDVSGLAIGAQIRVGELAIPSGATTDQDLEALVVHVTAPRGLTSAEEEAAAAEADEAAVGGVAPAAPDSPAPAKGDEE